MEFPYLQDLTVIFFLSTLVLLATVYLRLPLIVGLIAIGVIAGPHGLHLIVSVEQMEVLSEIGLILLLFSLGMEFPLRRVISMLRAFLIGGGCQVALTCFFGFLTSAFLGRPINESIFLGCMLSLSSTAIVLKNLSDRKEETTLAAKITLSILIFQDLIAIPMLLIIPLLSSSFSSISFGAWLALCSKIVFFIALVFLFSGKIMPTLLYLVVKTKRREIFLLVVMAICFSVTWVSALMGLSPSLGAFLAGLILADSEYHYQAISQILPIQDILISFFFISVGMLLDVQFFWSRPFSILAISIAVILLKSCVASFSALLLKIPLRVAVIIGLSLAQIGEFSLVLAKSGMQLGIASSYDYQLFLAVSVVTMALTPFLIAIAPSIAHLLSRISFLQGLKNGLLKDQDMSAYEKKNHVVIIGYGVSGQQLAKACNITQIEYAILENDPKVVQEARQKGEEIHFGDATHHSILQRVNLEKARVVAIVIDDSAAIRRIVKHIHTYHPNLPLIVRTPQLKEVNLLYSLGATQVIAGDAEATIMLFQKLLQKCDFESEKIDALCPKVRASLYGNA